MPAFKLRKQQRKVRDVCLGAGLQANTTVWDFLPRRTPQQDRTRRRQAPPQGPTLYRSHCNVAEVSPSPEHPWAATTRHTRSGAGGGPKHHRNTQRSPRIPEASLYSCGALRAQTWA